MKKFIVRLLCIPFIPIIAALVANETDYNSNTRIGFIRAVRTIWSQWWVE